MQPILSKFTHYFSFHQTFPPISLNNHPSRTCVAWWTPLLIDNVWRTCVAWWACEELALAWWAPLNINAVRIITNHSSLTMYLPPPQVPYPKHRLPQSFLWITPHESHYPLQLPQSMLNHSTFFQRNIPSVILSKIPSLHYLLQQFSSLLLIRLTNHPRLKIIFL